MGDIAKEVERYLKGPSAQIESLYIYCDAKGSAKMVTVQSVQDWDWTDIFAINVDLSKEIEVKKATIKRLTTQISKLNKDKADAQNALNTLKKLGVNK